MARKSDDPKKKKILRLRRGSTGLKEHDILKRYVNFARSQHHTSSLKARHVEQNKLYELFKLFCKVELAQ